MKNMLAKIRQLIICLTICILSSYLYDNVPEHVKFIVAFTGGFWMCSAHYIAGVYNKIKEDYDEEGC